MILVVDNHDSFTWNIVRYLRELDAEVQVVRNDVLTVADAMASGADAYLISPGPGTPEDAGISLGLIAAAAEVGAPLLGVCLGHQAIAQAFGGTIRRAGRPMHGKTSSVTHADTGLFEALPSPFTAARYHSLDVDALPPSLEANAWAEDGSIMGLRHRTLPIHGVQFHPESVASEHGHALFARFLRLAAQDRGSA